MNSKVFPFFLLILVPLSTCAQIPGGYGEHHVYPSPNKIASHPDIANAAQSNRHRRENPIITNQKLYDLGKKIFNGRIEVARHVLSEAEREAQEKQFHKIIKFLPKKARKKLEDANLSGRLTAEQYDALNYYLYIKYIFNK